MQSQDEKLQVSPTQRYLALKALRDYIYIANPTAATSADFIEDIPPLRPYGAFFSDVGPSIAAISSNPEERRKQIEHAKKLISHEDQPHPKDIPKEMLSSGLRFGLGSIPPSILFSLLTRSVHLNRNGFHFPKLTRNELLSGVGEDVGVGAGLATGFGAAAPLFASSVAPSRQALNQAGDILNKAPYSSAFPGAGLSASYNYNTKDSEPERIGKSMSAAGLYGAGMGGLGYLGQHALAQGSHHGKNLYNKAFSYLTKKKYIPSTSNVPSLKLKNFGKAGLIGTGVGSTVGLLTSFINNDKYGPQ